MDRVHLNMFSRLLMTLELSGMPCKPSGGLPNKQSVISFKLSVVSK